MWVHDQIRAEDIFHVHANCLHLLLCASEKQGVVTWSHWFLCKTGWRPGWSDPSCNCSKGPQILSTQPYLLCVTCRMNGKSNPYSNALSPGSSCFPQLVHEISRAQLCLHYKKTNSLKRVETEAHREGSTETVKIPALWHWKWCWCVHKCQQQL